MSNRKGEIFIILKFFTGEKERMRSRIFIDKEGSLDQMRFYKNENCKFIF